MDEEFKNFEREFCGNCSHLDCDGKSYMKCFKEYKKELKVPTTLQDLIDFAKKSNNDNPSIWLLDDQCDDYDQACGIEDIDLDEDGDIIIKVNIETLEDL